MLAYLFGYIRPVRIIGSCLILHIDEAAYLVTVKYIKDFYLHGLFLFVTIDVWLDHFI